jgi:hypothetical protein
MMRESSRIVAVVPVRACSFWMASRDPGALQLRPDLGVVRDPALDGVDVPGQLLVVLLTCVSWSCFVL